MSQVLLVACLAASASALVMDLESKDTSEQFPSFRLGAAAPAAKCHDGTWKWTKRNSSALRDTYGSEKSLVKKIYYINVDGNDGRKKHMQSELSQKAGGVKYERFSAFAASKLNKHEKSPSFKAVASLYSKARYTPWLLKDATKEVFAAIHISNYQVMEKILKEDKLGDKSDSVYMVMEDDSTLDSQWQRKLKPILENTPAEWDILRVGYWGSARCNDRENNYVFAVQPPSKDANALGGGHFYSGNTAYLVRPKSIPRILDIMRNSSFASIENVLMYPHRFPDQTDHQVLSYAVSPDHMLVNSAGLESSHGR